jgi:hypothetical protein
MFSPTPWAPRFRSSSPLVHPHPPSAHPLDLACKRQRSFINNTNVPRGKAIFEILRSGEIDAVLIGLGVVELLTQVQVGLSPTEVAEEQIKVEEKQRGLGVLPNFHVSYIPDAVPLNMKQEFTLAWKTVVDPFTFLPTGGVARAEQAQNHCAGYGPAGCRSSPLALLGGGEWAHQN